MFSTGLFGDLFGHMEWADARIWRAALGSPAACADTALRDRLFHIHLTQRAFLQLWTGRPLERYQAMKFESLEALYAWIRPYYPELAAFLATPRAAQHADPLPVPWAKYFVPSGAAAAPTTLGETMFQVTAHSAYHRGQVNTRLRDLGAEPPIVDYIGWLWFGRPATEWPAP